MSHDIGILWGLTPREQALFEILMARQVAHVESLCAAIWGDKPVHQEVMVKQLVCRMRPKLLAHDVRIVTHYGFGYSITEVDKAKVRQQAEDSVA